MVYGINLNTILKICRLNALKNVFLLQPEQFWQSLQGDASELDSKK